jgi:hypothetical protein
MSDLDLIYGTKPHPPPPPAEKTMQADIPVRKPVRKQARPKESRRAKTIASQQDSLQASNHASMLALSPEALEAIRKVVKNPGKADVLYVRVSKEEKDALEDLKYTYKRQGIKTSDNEVARVAINALLEDYKLNGANSLLAKMLESLHA